MIEIHDSSTEAWVMTRLRQLDAALVNGDSEIFNLSFGEFSRVLGKRGAEILVVKRYLKLFPDIDASSSQQPEEE